MPFFDQYPYTNFHNVNLDWVLERVKEWGQMVEDNNTRFENLQEANDAFKTYVTEYLENLDVQAQIDDKLDRMFESGELTEYLQPYVSNTVTNWLNENITEPEGVIIDSSLTVEGACADSKAVGEAFIETDDKINDLKAYINNMHDGLTDNAKNALLNCFEHIALWTNGDGQALIDELERELYYVPPIIEYPNLERGNVLTNYYFDAQGNTVSRQREYCNTEFFNIENDTDYYWIQGFNGNVSDDGTGLKGGCNSYRVCYYDSNKNFIGRWLNPLWTEDFDYIEPRYEKLEIPNNARYFRVSWGLLPCGNIYKSIPRNLYAVTIVLANIDDTIITDDDNLPSRFTVTRNGVNVTNQIKTGNNTISVDDRIGYEWTRNIFSVLQGGSPETGLQNPNTQTRIYNTKTFLLKTGDAIHFDNVKSAVRAERIYDGYLQHSLQWNTTNETFIIGE